MCDDSFDDTAADAICKTMNYAGAIRWTTSDADFGHIKYDYQITLDDVTCSRTEWTSCTYNSDRNDCSHSEDVQLSCRTHEQADEGNQQDSLVVTQLMHESYSDHIIIVLKNGSPQFTNYRLLQSTWELC